MQPAGVRLHFDSEALLLFLAIAAPPHEQFATPSSVPRSSLFAERCCVQPPAGISLLLFCANANVERMPPNTKMDVKNNNTKIAEVESWPQANGNGNEVKS